MSSSEEDSYSMIFTSLKHPIRRKILRVLSSEAQTFSDLQKQFKIESSHLKYHIDGLGNLLYKAEDGKYALSSLGEAAVSMMRNVEEPSTTSHLPFMRARSNESEKKLASRAVAIALGIIGVVLAATIVGAFTYYVPLVNSKSSTISSLNSQVADLRNQIAFDNITMASLQNQIDFLSLNLTILQNQLASDNFTINSLSLNVTRLLEKLGTIQNWSASIQDMVMSNPADWVNKTVILEGHFDLLVFPAFMQSPYYSEIEANNLTIGVSYLSINNASFASFWNEVNNGAGMVKILGVVEKGEITYTGNVLPPIVVYYVKATDAEPL